MNITLSVATSADLYIDDMTPHCLTLSTAEDWAEVYRLRAEHDAILVGGETLRRDDPSLGLKGVESGAKEPLRVVVSGVGEISLQSKIFHKGSASIIIFSSVERPELSGVAEVVVAESIDVPFIVTQLERRGVRSLFVEGGAQILRMFMGSGLVDRLRVATNPAIVVDDLSAPRFDASKWVEGVESQREDLGGMDVVTYTFARRGVTQEDRELMARTIEVSRNSPPRDSCYRVGAVIKTLAGEIFEGYTLETSPTHHAEQAAIHKALAAGADIKGATIYASMEPCSQRSSEPESCSALIIRYGLRRALFALYEPSHFVECHGAENMRRAGVEVCCVSDFADEVLEINSHVLAIVE